MTEVRRIASLLSSATEILFALEAGDRVVAVGHECDYPPAVADLPRVTFSLVDSANDSATIDEQVKQLATAGDALYGVDDKQIVELAPDVIVTQSQCDVCAVRYQDVLDLVERTPELRGTPVVALNPTSLEELCADIRRVGTAIGSDAVAERLVGTLDTRVKAVAKTAASLAKTHRPRVACVEWIEPLMLGANWMPQMVNLAGGQNVISEAGHSTYSTWDTVLDFDPEVIVVMPCGFDLERAIAESGPLLQRTGWAGLSAVQQGRVYAVDGNAYFNRSGPRLVDSLEILAHLIHPQHFPLESLSSDAARAMRRLVD